MLVLAATAGALSGATAALMVTPYTVSESSVVSPVATLPSTVSTSTVSGPSLVRLQPRLAEPLLPSGFLTRRSSPVASLYRRARGTTLEERTLTDDRLLGQAVALTSDGWFVTVTSAVAAVLVAELTVWHEGRAYPVSRGTTDRLNGTTYLKIEATDLSVPAFGDVLDLVSGSEMWLERRAESFAPSLVISLTELPGSVDILSSEVVGRRIALDGVTSKGDVGSPAWNPGGALIGLLESAAGEPVRLIPSSSIATSFSSLLSEGVIRHASLGVRATDLFHWRIDGDRGALPLRGALLRDERKVGKLAVSKDSPAAQAGLKAGDVILSVERDILDGTRDLGEILSEYRPGASVSVRISRDGIEMDVPVTLGTMISGETLK